MQQDELSVPRLHPVNRFAQRFPAWTPAAIRALIYAAEDRVASGGRVIKGNGLAEAGAIIRLGRRVLIDEQAFFQWIADQQRVTRQNAARSGTASVSAEPAA